MNPPNYYLTYWLPGRCKKF